MTRTELEIELEDFIDKRGLADVLDALVVVCFEKEDHLRTNWQNTYQAKAWEKVAKRINNISVPDAINF